MAKNNPIDNSSLRDKTMRECRAMIEHAQANGKPVPPGVLQVLAKLEAKTEAEKDPNNVVMASRSAEYQATNPGETDADLVGQLAAAHNAMQESIYPATPESVIHLQEERDAGGIFSGLGSVKLVRRMNLIVIISLSLFVGLFATHQVSWESIAKNILNEPDPATFLLNQLFMISMAALGAAFFNLFEAYKYITEGTYDSKYESVYWIRFTLGIVSGIMLSEFIFTDISGVDGSGGGFAYSRPLLAFLGGFSARVVYRILTRLVEALESFIDGSAKDMIAAREQVAKVQLEQKLNTVRQENADKMSMDRLNAAMQLIAFKERLASGNASNDEVKSMVDNLLSQAMGPISAGANTNNNGLGNLQNTNTGLSDFNLTPVTQQTINTPPAPVSPMDFTLTDYTPPTTSAIESIAVETPLADNSNVLPDYVPPTFDNSAPPVVDNTPASFDNGNVVLPDFPDVPPPTK